MNRVVKNLGIYAIIFALVLGIAWFYQGTQGQKVTSVDFSEFVTDLQSKQVKELTIVDTNLTGTLKSGEIITAYAPSIVELYFINEKYVFPQIEEGNLEMTSQKPSSSSWVLTLLPTIVMVLIFVLFWFLFMQQGQGGGKGVMSFGKSRAKLFKEDELRKVTFADVAGLDEEKEELAEIVDFLKHRRNITVSAQGSRRGFC